MTEKEEIQKAISQEQEEKSLIREFKSLGVIIPTKFQWQQLALDICEYWALPPKTRPWVFMLCKKYPYKTVRERFDNSKEKGIHYFLACFRKTK